VVGGSGLDGEVCAVSADAGLVDVDVAGVAGEEGGGDESGAGLLARQEADAVGGGGDVCVTRAWEEASGCGLMTTTHVPQRKGPSSPESSESEGAEDRMEVLGVVAESVGGADFGFLPLPGPPISLSRNRGPFLNV
jgi:hypothetical protein